MQTSPIVEFLVRNVHTTVGMRHVVHLKLSGEHPPEVQEAVIIRESNGECAAMLNIRRTGGVTSLTIPFAPCRDLDLREVESLEGEWAKLLDDPAYERLLDDLQQLSRSME